VKNKEMCEVANQRKHYEEQNALENTRRMTNLHYDKVYEHFLGFHESGKTGSLLGTLVTNVPTYRPGFNTRQRGYIAIYIIVSFVCIADDKA
jgi:hypothetical protein